MRRLECTAGGLEKYDLEGTAAPHWREFVKKYAPTWRCVEGRNFSGHTEQDIQPYIHFYHWTKRPVSCSDLAENVDCARHPGIYPQTGPAA